MMDDKTAGITQEMIDAGVFVLSAREVEGVMSYEDRAREMFLAMESRAPKSHLEERVDAIERRVAMLIGKSIDTEARCR